MSGAAARPGVAPGALSALLQDLARPEGTQERATWVGALYPGAVIASYELIRQVGRGGFGIVYEARDLRSRRVVAFKAVCGGGRPELREERVLQEAELAARLSHRNIVALYDVGRCEHGPYLVLELLRGETLAQHISRGVLPIGEALRIASDIAGAMAFAHAAGVVHRDLTPGNVFLCRDGAVKVLDLGMAHAFGRRKLDGGTPAYMAPEQRRGAPEDERTDVYAMGVVLHEMLLGRVPPVRRVHGSSSEVDGAPGLAELLDTMLASDAIDRPRDAGEVSAALATVVADLRCDRGKPAALRSPVTAERASLAVLPFAEVGAAVGVEHLGEGLAQEILHRLARVRELRVVGRASSFSVDAASTPAVGLGQELNVSAVLQGDLRRDGTRVTVTPALWSVPDGARIWACPLEGELADVRGLADEVARAVARALGLALPSGSGAESVHRRVDVGAYGTYLRGQHLFARGRHAEALEHFEAALAIDPHYAPVLAGVAFAALFLQEFDRDVHAATERPRQAIAAAERAVAEGPDLADGHAARGLVRAAFVHDWDGALADVDRAVALRPDAEIMRAQAIVRIALGRLPEALSILAEATRLDPLSPAAWNTLGAAHLAAGDMPAAELSLQRALGVSPAQAYAPGNLGTVLLLQGRTAEALAAWQRSTSEIVRLMGNAVVGHRSGDRATAEGALETMISRYGDQGAFRIAQVLAAWGEPMRAIGWLERARRTRSARLAFEVKSHPFLRSLRDDPRYRALLERLDLPVD